VKEKIGEQDLLISRLQKELEEKSERLKDTHRKNEGQEFQIRELEKSFYHAFNKPLPPLPRKAKQNRFRQLETKIKTGFQKLVEKTKGKN